MLAKFILFLCSYSPLMVIWGILRVQNEPALAAGLWLMAAGSITFGVAAYLAVRTLKPSIVKIASVSGKDGDAMSYIVSYLLPFLALGTPGAHVNVAMAIVFFILAVIYVNSNMVHTNPVLNLAGYHLFEVETPNGKRVTIISRRGFLPTTQPVSVRMFGDYVGLEARTTDGK